MKRWEKYVIVSSLRARIIAYTLVCKSTSFRTLESVRDKRLFTSTPGWRKNIIRRKKKCETIIAIFRNRSIPIRASISNNLLCKIFARSALLKFGTIADPPLLNPVHSFPKITVVYARKPARNRFVTAGPRSKSIFRYAALVKSVLITRTYKRDSMDDAWKILQRNNFECTNE